MLTSAEIFSRRAASLPEPDRNTILLFVSSVLMNGRTYRTNRVASLMLVLLVLTPEMANRQNAGYHSASALQQGCLKTPKSEEDRSKASPCAKHPKI